MKVLVAHNRYRSSTPSGENSIVDAEIRLLRDGGVDVTPLLVSSDDIVGISGFVRAALGPLYSPEGVRSFARLLADSRPDVVHIHNVFPLLSPWIVRTAHAARVPVVQTMHNYRHTCINGQHFRNGRACDDCVGLRMPLPAVAHGCYRQSRSQSFPMAVGQLAHRSTWRSVDAFIALTEFMVERLTVYGIERSRIRLRPTWTEDPGRPAPPGRDVLFVGRLDEQKGLRLLLDAWKGLDPLLRRRLLIAGDGPLGRAVAETARDDARVVPLGRVPNSQVSTLMRECAVVVVPSLWYEGYPLVIAEAFSQGRGVLVTEGTSAASAVSEACGLRIPPTADAWRERLMALTDHELAAWGAAARTHYEERGTPKAALASLRSTYLSVAHATPDV